MEITDINIISDFDAGFKCLQNPSLISPFFPITGIFKWGALILAIFAKLINRIMFLIIRIPSINCSLKPLLDDEVFYYSDDDTSSSETQSDDEELESTSSFEDGYQGFRVAGSSYYRAEEGQNGNMKLRRRLIGGCGLSWPDFSAGKSVVQLWDSLGLSLDFEDSSSFCSDKISSKYMASPVVVLWANMSNSESIAFGAYDTRVARDIPVITVEWQSRLGNFVGISSSAVEKVYIRDDCAGEVTVGDLRNVKTPLEKLTEYGCR